MLPHLGVIPDGNRRYHRAHPGDEGASERAVNTLIEWARGKVLSLSIFGWSLENFGRPPDEVAEAMRRLHRFLKSQRADGDVSFAFIGDRQRLPREVCDEMRRLECAARTKAAKLTVYIYVAYGFLQSPPPPPQRHHRRCASWPSTVTTPPQPNNPPPPLDCLVRTSGEHRLSNFCLDRLAYAELFFIPALFPECNESHWDGILTELRTNRKRRFGI